MNAGRYRKKPVEVDAIRYDGHNFEGIAAWVTYHGGFDSLSMSEAADTLVIHTLEGDMRADVGDWIIRGVAGEFYPCRPDIFTAIYEAVS